MSACRPQNLAKIRNYIMTEIAAGAPDGEISDSTPLMTAGLIDSIAMMRLVSFLENEFSVSIEAEDISIENLDSIGSIVRFVERKNSIGAQADP